MTKLETISRALLNGERLTHLKALAYNTHRLAVFIHTLRKRDGWNIVSEEKHDLNGNKFTEYYLPSPAA